MPTTTRVALIEDSEIVRETMELLLRQEGFEVLALDSAIGASHALVRFAPHVLLLDLNLPMMSGEKFAEMFGRATYKKDARVVLVSGESDDELERIRAAVGADAVVPKRALAVDLVPTVKRLVGTSPGTSDPPTSRDTLERSGMFELPDDLGAVVDLDRARGQELADRIAPFGLKIAACTPPSGVEELRKSRRPSFWLVASESSAAALASVGAGDAVLLYGSGSEASIAAEAMASRAAGSFPLSARPADIARRIRSALDRR